jgi:hypothetical protein
VQIFVEQGGIGVRWIGGADSPRRGRTDGDYDQPLPEPMAPAVFGSPAVKCVIS